MYLTETSRRSTRNNLQVEDTTFQSLRESLEKIDRWQFVEEIEGLKRQLYEKDRQLEQQNVRTNTAAATCTTTATSPCHEEENNSNHNASSSNHMDIVHELLQLRHSHAMLRTQYDHQTVLIQNSMIDANHALDSIVHLEGHTLHGRHMCASAQCVGWLLSARQGVEAVVSMLSIDGNPTPTSTKPGDIQTTAPSNQPTDPVISLGSVEAVLAGSTTEQALMEMCKRLELENQVLKEKVTRLEEMSLVESSAKYGDVHDKVNGDDDPCGSGESTSLLRYITMTYSSHEYLLWYPLIVIVISDESKHELYQPGVTSTVDGGIGIVVGIHQNVATHAVSGLDKTMCDSVEHHRKHDEQTSENKENTVFDNSIHHQRNDERGSKKQDDDASSLDHTSLVRLLQRINRERDELALLLVQQSSETAAIKAQADLIPQYRQGVIMFYITNL